ncbi:hypothetical protein ALO97_01609 [Pseudomonas syringae pv. tagetis]|nr:hypothetical protein ALO98_200113 [Pseudomonas syringae pv. tagetis]RMW14471.1 hypothetical protein ALO97_01609 [Pseudomonas syringae pv. tagetis]
MHTSLSIGGTLLQTQNVSRYWLMGTLENVYTYLTITCKKNTQKIASDVENIMTSIHSIKETVTQLETVVAAAKYRTAGAPLLPQPVFLPARLLERDIKALNVAVDGMATVIKNKLTFALEELRTTLANELNSAFEATPLNVENSQKYQVVLIESIVNLEMLHAMITEAISP